MRVIRLECTASTSEDLTSGVKKGIYGTKDVICAEYQTKGRGRLGKSFSSPRGGLYFSFCKESFESGLTTVICAVAVSKVLEKYGFEPKIKWVNDIYIGSKKVCGILTQAVGDNKRCVIGVGLNLVSDAIPSELSDIAAALDAFGKVPNKDDLMREMILTFDSLLSEDKTMLIDYYKDHLCHMGKAVTVVSTGEECVTVGVDLDGSLIVKNSQGVEKKLSSGEISIKIN